MNGETRMSVRLNGHFEAVGYVNIELPIGPSASALSWNTINATVTFVVKMQIWQLLDMALWSPWFGGYFE